MLKLQARGSDSEAVRRQLYDASVRIGTIGTLHSRLQKEDTALEGDARSYLEGVIADRRTALGEAAHRPIVLDACEPGALVLKADMLVALGLIAAEAVTNAIKHGAGRISVRLDRTETHLELAVDDEGAGLPAHYEPVRDGSGLGMRMIASLVHARSGQITVGFADKTNPSASNGLRATIPL